MRPHLTEVRVRARTKVRTRVRVGAEDRAAASAPDGGEG